jgi:hypothetical protein
MASMFLGAPIVRSPEAAATPDLARRHLGQPAGTAARVLTGAPQ